MLCGHLPLELRAQGSRNVNDAPSPAGVKVTGRGASSCRHTVPRGEAQAILVANAIVLGLRAPTVGCSSDGRFGEREGPHGQEDRKQRRIGAPVFVELQEGVGAVFERQTHSGLNSRSQLGLGGIVNFFAPQSSCL